MLSHYSEERKIITNNYFDHPKLLETQVLEELTKTILKDFLGEILVFEMGTCPKSGYDVLTGISKKFNHRLSSGTIYSKLYSLERDGILKCIKTEKENFRAHRLRKANLKHNGKFC
jgi:DNA-binding PadR family transcriptional regulator